jgi:hypothetical protein
MLLILLTEPIRTLLKLRLKTTVTNTAFEVKKLKKILSSVHNLSLLLVYPSPIPVPSKYIRKNTPAATETPVTTS